MSAPGWARKGVKVVCINGDGSWDARGWFKRYKVDGPRKDEVSTIIGTCFDSQDGWCVILKEYPIIVRGKRDGYTVDDFRPLVEHKQEARDKVTFDEWLKTPERTE